jgi:hypothetical protein
MRGALGSNKLMNYFVRWTKDTEHPSEFQLTVHGTSHGHVLLESFSLLLVGLQENEERGLEVTCRHATHILLGIRQCAPLLAELGRDVFDVDAGVGLHDLQGRRHQWIAKGEQQPMCLRGMLTASRISLAKTK